MTGTTSVCMKRLTRSRTAVMSSDIAGSMKLSSCRAVELRRCRTRYQLDSRDSGRRGYHGVDVTSVVAAILGAVCGVDPLVEVVVGCPHEGDVLVDAPGPDVALVADLSRTEPGAGTALP